MTTITVELPDELAEEAQSQGLLESAAVEAMIRETLRRRAGKELLEAADKLATATKCLPMTMAEIQEEVDAVRSDRRGAISRVGLSAGRRQPSSRAQDRNAGR